MEAPDRLYISKNIYGTFIYQVPNPDDDTEVEYIRVDAIANPTGGELLHVLNKGVEQGYKDAVDKACEFLKDRILHDSIDYPMATMHLIDDFKNYMKGE